MQLEKTSLVSPLGKGDYERGERWVLMKALYPRLAKYDWTLGIDFKGNSLEPEKWVLDIADEIRNWGGFLGWHPSKVVSESLGDPKEPLPPSLLKCARQAKSLGLKLLTIHSAAKTENEPGPEAGLGRYSSTTTPEEDLARIEAMIDPLCQAAEASGGVLSLEPTDMAQFRDGGYHLPTFKEQIWAGMLEMLLYLRSKVEERSGIRMPMTFDDEHVLGLWNFKARRRDLASLPWWQPAKPRPAQVELADITGCWFEKGMPPVLLERPPDYATDLEWDMAIINDGLKKSQPVLIHTGASVQATRYNPQTAQDEIDTHLPYNAFDTDQMTLLDLKLQYAVSHPDCYGIENEVVGSGFLLGRYSPWSPRPFDNEMAMFLSAVVEVDRIAAISS